jgi:NIMA (never in mitosis gene a)-related kinase 2
MSRDQYEVLQLIGTGSFGSVSKIKRKSDGHVMVWKEINFGRMSEKEKTQLVSEVNIIRELRNPFIVKYHDRIVHKASTKLYIIMEYCGGGDLENVIKRCRRERTNIDEGLIWRVLAQSVLALKDCHRRVENNVKKPILHRDLKPGNILLDNDKNIKMADFGLAKELSSKSQLAKTNLGTPYYMAPEIINEKDYDEKADIWSLGCLIYQLAALKPPFDGANAYKLGMNINAGRYSRIPNKYSQELMNVIARMLQLQPRKRPSVEELEVAPGISNAMRSARNIVNIYNQQQSLNIRNKELKVKEAAVLTKEAELKKLEAYLNDKQKALTKWQHRLEAQSQTLHNPTASDQDMEAITEGLKAAQVTIQRRRSYDGVLDNDQKSDIKELEQRANVPPPVPQEVEVSVGVKHRVHSSTATAVMHSNRRNAPPPPPRPVKQQDNTIGNVVKAVKEVPQEKENRGKENIQREGSIMSNRPSLNLAQMKRRSQAALHNAVSKAQTNIYGHGQQMSPEVENKKLRVLRDISVNK